MGSGSLRSARWLLVGGLGVAATVFTHLAPGLPLDDLATRLKPGARVSELCAGSDSGDSVRICLDALTPELEEGDHLLVISAIDDPGLVERLDDLNALTSDPDAARIWLLTWSTEEELGPFFWQYGPAFEIREVPEALLATLYRTAPRTFYVLDGEVHETYSGIPDGEALMAASRARSG